MSAQEQVDELERLGIDVDGFIRKIHSMRVKLGMYRGSRASQVLTLIPENSNVALTISRFGEELLAIESSNAAGLAKSLRSYGFDVIYDPAWGEVHIKMDPDDITDALKIQRIRKLLYKLHTLDFD